MVPFPEPARTDDLRLLLLTYLDFYRDVVAAKVRGLTPAHMSHSCVGSGWTPAGLVTHLAYMERRWLQWGFLGEQVEDPWSDGGRDGWVAPSADPAPLLERLHREGRRTREIVLSHELTDLAATGGRFGTEQDTPQLQWILLHVLQEYARHAGHLDIARELADGSVGKAG